MVLSGNSDFWLKIQSFCADKKLFIALFNKAELILLIEFYQTPLLCEKNLF